MQSSKAKGYWGLILFLTGFCDVAFAAISTTGQVEMTIRIIFGAVFALFGLVMLRDSAKRD
jgi:hypothetical protein